jgi:hypothetical protein
MMPKARMVLLTIVVLARGLSAQFAVGTLTRLGDYESRRTSSYDRSGANGDYRHLKAGETMELYNEAGPGEIRHVWITMAAGEVYHLYSVAYWHQKDPHGKYPPLPAAEQRIPKFINTGGPGQDPKMK